MVALRRAGVVVVVAVLALSLAGAAAGGKKKKKRKGQVWGSQITLAHPSATQFTGRVSSNLSACHKQRLVNVFYTDTISGKTALLSVQRTDGEGRYAVNLTQPAFSGTYQAQAAHERIRARKAPQTCREATGNAINF
jgi:hypothetical protein